MYKRFLSALVIAMFLCSSATFAYDDVNKDSEYFNSVQYLMKQGVFTNTKSFKPDTLISKVDFIKYLVLFEDDTPEFAKKINLPFSDTQNNAWYAPYVHEAIQYGILSDKDEKLYPYKKVSLMDAVELLFHSRHIPIPKKWKGGKIPYNDVAKNHRVGPMIMQALNFGIVEPERDDYAGIYKRITKGQAAKMIYNMNLVNLASSRSTTKNALNTLNGELQKVISIWNLIEGNFVNKDDLDYNALSEGAIKGLVEAVDDPYTAYLDPKQNNAFSDDLDGEIEGIGAYIGINDDKDITIVSPIAGSPAEAAGIKAGDIIKKVDGVDVEGLTLYEVVNKIKGKKGTSVNLTVLRGSNTKNIMVLRDTIIIHAVETKIINDIMVIKITTFSQKAAKEFQDAVEIVQANNKIKGIVIDLRDNPGGLLNAATAILDHILRKDSVSLNVKYNFLSYTQYANGPSELADYPMAVIINKGSASASEIVAGALQDYDIATIVGEQSFGKGTVQEINYFSDSSSLKLTVAKWLTPLNHDIQKFGITPEVKIVDNLSTSHDEVLNKAINEVKKRM